jgi:hypothetical protein
MIFDRTQNDADTAILLRNTKVKTFQELTESEIATLERGMLTINTLNRIETKQEELKNLFNEIGYWNTPIANKAWGENDIFDADEFQRIIDNTNALRNAFIVYNGTPNTPGVSYHWQDINALERILNDLDVMINDVKSHYRECGTFECGEELLND